MRAYTDMVTAIAAPIDNSDVIVVTSSRDRSIILWHLTKEETAYVVPRRRLNRALPLRPGRGPLIRRRAEARTG
jgi:hypothetical protein